MFKKKQTVLLPYLLLALAIVIVQPLLSWYGDFSKVDTLLIEYLPEGATSPVVYQVEEKTVQRSSECITFLPIGNQENEYLTLCDRYQEVRE